MFDENNVPVGQRYDFFMRCCQRLRYGKSECLRLWVERKPQRAAIDGSPPGRSQKVTSACLPICVARLHESQLSRPAFAEHPGVSPVGGSLVVLVDRSRDTRGPHGEGRLGDGGLSIASVLAREYADRLRPRVARPHPRNDQDGEYPRSRLKNQG